MRLKPQLTSPPTSPFPYSAILGGMLLLLLISTGCSRSPWMKTDGHEVAPTEQLECVRQVQYHGQGEVFEQEVLEQRIEQCMLDKGYKRRPWWLLNDLHWHVNEPAY